MARRPRRCQTELVRAVKTSRIALIAATLMICTGCSDQDEISKIDFYDVALSEVKFCLQSGKRCAHEPLPTILQKPNSPPKHDIPLRDKRDECFRSIKSMTLDLSEKYGELRIECTVDDKPLFVEATGFGGTASETYSFPVASISRTGFRPDGLIEWRGETSSGLDETTPD